LSKGNYKGTVLVTCVSVWLLCGYRPCRAGCCSVSKQLYGTGTDFGIAHRVQKALLVQCFGSPKDLSVQGKLSVHLDRDDSLTHHSLVNQKCLFGSGQKGVSKWTRKYF